MKPQSRCLVLVGLLLLTAGTARAEDPPPLGLETVIQGPGDLSWESLEGQALVLDFWATWCSPCRASIPHLNQLKASLDGEPIRFLSVTDEPRELVERFLRQLPIAGWVGLDTDRSMFDDFKVNGLPHTILVDRQHRIQAATHPLAVDSRVLRDLIAGKPLDVLDLSEMPDALTARPETSIKPSGVGRTGMQVMPGWRAISGVGVDALISLAYNKHPLWVTIEGQLPEGRFDAVVVSGPDEDWQEVLAKALAETFDLSIEKVTETRSVWVLTKGPEWESKLRRPETSDDIVPNSRPGLLSTRETLSFSRHIAAMLDHLVVDGAELEGLWMLDLEYAPENPQGLFQAVQDQLGLQLVWEKRPVEFLRVRSRTE